MELERRRFLAACWAAAGGLKAFAGTIAAQPLENARLLGTLPFLGEGGRSPGVRTGTGLGGRRVFDLSRLDSKSLVTPADRFFIRTSAPDRLPPLQDWRIRLSAPGQAASEIALEELRRRAREMGEHLAECSGNGSHRAFGLMSSARWQGVPVTEVLDRRLIERKRLRVLIAGFDEHSGPAAGSTQGASWIFSLRDLEESRAFLATGMNAGPLTIDHGEPVRLAVPGWYGCCWPKWVDRIELVGDDAPATAQMREFAGRTHQEDIHSLARLYSPARMDCAAMPVRVERWKSRGRLVHRLVGILWGGRQPVRRLAIRFNPDDPFEPVRDLRFRSNSTWSLWSHLWKPPRPGRYRIRLSVEDPRQRTRRLDSGFYDRQVEVDEV